MTTIADFIPIGRDNAVSRQQLLHHCIDAGLCDDDRAMRQLIQKARIDYVILARTEGGYYRPNHDDILDLQRYIRTETKRAISIFRDIKRAKKLYEDYKRGVL